MSRYDYLEDECPNCGEAIPYDFENCDECERCGYVLTFLTDREE